METMALLSLVLSMGGAGPSSSQSSNSAPRVDPRVFHIVSTRAPQLKPQEAWKWAQTIESSAQKHGLPTSLVLGVITVESAFRSRVVSIAGAVGLMQVMPRTGEEWAHNLGIKWQGRRSLQDPLTNIRLGTAYLKWLLKRFGGNRDLALASYCHGPGLIRRFVNAGAVPKYRLRYARKVSRAERSVLATFRRVPGLGVPMAVLVF